MNRDKVYGIFLAAGKGERMGGDKLALPIGEDTIGNMTLSKALQSYLDHIFVVAKKTDDLSWIAQKNERWSRVDSEKAELGQSHSVRAGIQAAMSYNAEAV
ncbi:NTP transferase domain-containing protein, partial [Gracilibacillus oryzae]